MHILYRDSSLNTLEHLIKSGSTWSTETELDSGDAIGYEHASLQLSNGTTLVATTVNNSGVHELQIVDIDHDVSTTLTTLIDDATGFPCAWIQAIPSSFFHLIQMEIW